MMATAAYSVNSREVNFYQTIEHRKGSRLTGSESSGMDDSPLVVGDDGFETDDDEYLLRPRQVRGTRNRGLGYYLSNGFCLACSKCCEIMCFKCRRKKEHQPRTLTLGRETKTKDGPRYPPNIIRNQKYNIITFVPLVCVNSSGL
ncbi:putative phospholipid-transporting ATPase IIB [Lamellibrachia satsuma]|nr:putative phospholipid-transporting ATPase IIB [Lamellibrachia satsuma]